MPEPDIPEVSAGQTIASTWGNTVRTKVQDLTDGHKHDGVGSKKVDHANLNNVMADQHHAKSHGLSDHASGSARISVGVDAGKPAPGTADRLYFALDTKILYRDTGSAWEEVLRAESVTRLAQLLEKSHSSLTGIGGNDHHVAFTPTDHDVRDHTVIAPSIALEELGSKAHTELTGITQDQHHARQHALDSASDHTGNITDTQHGSRGSGLHADSHVLDHRGRQLLQVGLDAGKPAAGTVGRIYYATDTKIFYYDNGATWEEYLRAETVSRLAQLAEKSHGSLTGVTADQHHARSHDHSLAADGSPIAVAGVPNLPASKITSEILAAARGGLGKVLDEAAIGDDKVIVYKTTGDKFVYEAKPAGGGDMYKSTYDVDDDGIVDNAEKLEGSTKSEVQNHAPQAHKASHVSGGGDVFVSTDLLEAIVKRLRESAGADLTLGAVADGKYLKRSGTSIIGDIPAGGAALFGGLLTPFDSDAYGGDTGYGVTRASWGVRIVTAATSGYQAWMRWRWHASIASYAFFDKNPQAEFFIRLYGTTLQDIYIFSGGICSAPTAVAKKFGIHIACDATTASLRIMSADGTAWSETADLMTLSIGWYRIKLKLTSGSQIEVWVDGVSKGTKTTNLPSGGFDASCEALTYNIKTGEGATKTLDASACKLEHD